MKLSKKWLRDYVELSDIDIKTFCHEMTMSGSKVETYENIGDGISNVVAGRVEAVSKHPGADRLLICAVDCGGRGRKQIVTGAENVFPGALVPVALDGAALPNGTKIREGKLRGETSQGMLCSVGELGLTLHECPGAAQDGILILEKGEPGEDIRTVLGLDDTVIEFEITPNRPDCNSVIGLAREAAATFRRELKTPEISLKREGDEISDYLTVSVENGELCSRYMAAVVKNVRIAPSPDWMRMRLFACGIRPINNIVDITNYCMLEYGQPMHAFDYACISGKKIEVRNARDGERAVTLDGKERALDGSMLVIADAERAVALAGVMGGENSEISEKTRTVVFESACFDGASVRQTSRALGMRTESSAMFEKGLPPENAELALARALELVELLNAGESAAGIADVYPGPRAPRKIMPDYEKINSLLGTELAPEEMDGYWKSLGIEKDGEMLLIPFWRDDIAEDCDLAEEAARLYGYNNIPVTNFKGGVNAVIPEAPRELADRILDICLALGYDEILTYTFISPRLYDRALIPADSPLRRSLSILNPIGGDEAVMRTTALPSLLLAVEANQKVRIGQAALFELAKVYIPALDGDGNVKSDVQPAENLRLMLAKYGEKTSFYDLKADLDALLLALCGEKGQYSAFSGDAALHPGRTAKVFAGGEEAGVIGEVSAGIMDEFGFYQRVYIADISFDALLSALRRPPVYVPVSKYPPLLRDIAVICREEITVGELAAAVKEAGGPLCKSVSLFDVYRGAPVPEGEKSVAFELVFADPEGTVNDERADALFEKIVSALNKRFGARLR